MFMLVLMRVAHVRCSRGGISELSGSESRPEGSPNGNTGGPARKLHINVTKTMSETTEQGGYGLGPSLQQLQHLHVT
jgi:hypothetical protein